MRFNYVYRYTFYYNCYCRINGVEDKLTYTSKLYQFYQKLINSGRKIVIVNECISIPTNEEIRMINRKNYTKDRYGIEFCCTDQRKTS